MGDSISPPDLTDLLQRAVSEAKFREPFLRALLGAEVFTLTVFDSIATDQPVSGLGPQNLLHLSSSAGPVVPFWTSMAVLETDALRMHLDQRQPVALPTTAFLRATRGMRVVLNPGTVNRGFTPEQAASLLARAQQEQATPAPAPKTQATPEPLPSVGRHSPPSPDSATGPDAPAKPQAKAQPSPRPDLPAPMLAVDARFESDFHQFVKEQNEPEEGETATEAESRQDMFAHVANAIAVVTPLFEGRSDIAWQRLAEFEEQGVGNNVARALSLLLFTAIDRTAVENSLDAAAALADHGEYWADWAAWFAEQPELQPVDLERIKELTTEQCGCGHPAFRHGPYSWTFRDLGTQTEAPCDLRLCICEGFFIETPG